MDWKRGDYTLSDDRDSLDIDVLRRFLASARFLAGENWTANCSRDQVAAAVTSSICFSLFCGQDLVGFVRALTDDGAYTYLIDVVIEPAIQGRGYESWAVECVLGYPGFAGTRLVLATADARDFYRQFGFETQPMEWMISQ